MTPRPSLNRRQTRGRSRTMFGVALVATALAGAVGCTTESGSASVVGNGTGDGGGSGGEGSGSVVPGDAGAIVWGDCDTPATDDERCGTLTVPLDHRDPDGATIELALNVLPARDADARIGILLVNPGGPGASGIDFARGGSWGSAVVDRFDIVGFDPRGVSRSTPIDCLSDAELEVLFDGPAAPNTDEQVSSALALSASAEAQCAAHPIGRFLGTRNVARDMDEIRKAFGEDALSFYGASYGTAIAAAYVDLFPQQARAIVMDSVVSPTASPQQQATDQAASFQELLGQFAAWCTEQGDGACPADPQASIQRLLAAADAEPIPVPEFGGRLSGTLAVLGVITAFYAEQVWPFLGDAMVRADAGDVSGIFQLSTFQTERQLDGSYTNLREALISIICSDAGTRMTVDEVRSLAQDLQARYPTFGAAAAWGSFGCTGWPEAIDPMVAPDSEDSDTVLIVGTVDDPATPYQGALDMRAALSNSVLLTFEGRGHVAYSISGCISDAVDRYLVDLEVPADGATCSR